MIWNPRKHFTKDGWEPWFAWFPVTLTNGYRVWWQRVERYDDGNWGGSNWKYRLRGQP